MSERASSSSAKPANQAVASAARTGLLQRKCDCGNHSPGGGQCDACKKKVGSQRKAIGSQFGGDLAVPQLATSPAAESGTAMPLAANIRQEMEQRFGFGFSAVRVHADAGADRQARQQGAHAFTVGSDIFFRAGNYQPQAQAGRWLLAHELTHVVQQTRGQESSQAFGAANTHGTEMALEREADHCATQALRGAPAMVQLRATGGVQAYMTCRQIFDAREETVVRESTVQAELATRLAASGPVERELPVPDGSFGAYRTEDRRRPNQNKPHEVGGKSQHGRGAADLVLLQGQTLEVAEVKRGDPLLVAEAVTQVHNYIEKANADLPYIRSSWAGRRGAPATIRSVRAMPQSRLPFTGPLMASGTYTSTAWCQDGVIAFKAIGSQDPRLFVCGSSVAVSDRFIDSLLAQGEIAIDRFVDTQVVPRVTQAVQTITLRQALQRMLANPAMNQTLRNALGPAADLLTQGGSGDALLDRLDQFLQGQADGVIRVAIEVMKDHVIAEVRRVIKQQLRQQLQSILNALCVGAAQVTAEAVLRELQQRLRQIAAQAIPVAVVAAVSAVIAELAASVGNGLLEALKYIGIAIGVVIVALALWEVAVAIAAGGALAELGAAIAAFFAQVARALAPLILA